MACPCQKDNVLTSRSSLNEGDPNEQDWQSVFYGENYPRLLDIKNRYDPNRVFYGRTAVGSEAWMESKDGRLCRKDMD